MLSGFRKNMTDRQYQIHRLRQAANAMEKNPNLSFQNAMEQILNEDVDKALKSK
jgi:hypothetical protein